MKDSEFKKLRIVKVIADEVGKMCYALEITIPFIRETAKNTDSVDLEDDLKYAANCLKRHQKRLDRILEKLDGNLFRTESAEALIHEAKKAVRPYEKDPLGDAVMILYVQKILLSLKVTYETIIDWCNHAENTSYSTPVKDCLDEIKELGKRFKTKDDIYAEAVASSGKE